VCWIRTVRCIGAVTTAESVSLIRNRGSEVSVSLQRVQGTTPPPQSTVSSEPQSTGRAIAGASVLSFRVAGTNATFKLPVILEGTVWGESAGDGQGAVASHFGSCQSRGPPPWPKAAVSARFGACTRWQFLPTATALRVTGARELEARIRFPSTRSVRASSADRNSARPFVLLRALLAGVI
jgi:hypothetical protein